MKDESNRFHQSDRFSIDQIDIHSPSTPVETQPDENRVLGRRSPIGRSPSSLVSRDYQPRTGGPELITSWPLGPSPSQDCPGDFDWELTATDPVVIQKNTFQQPYIGGLDYAPLYLNVIGWGELSTEGEELTLTLSHKVLSGKAFEATVSLKNTEKKPFASPMMEAVSESEEAQAQYDHLTKVFSGYELTAAVTGGTGYLDQGTCVQLWSE